MTGSENIKLLFSFMAVDSVLCKSDPCLAHSTKQVISKQRDFA